MDKQKAVSLLAQNLPQKVVADALGVTPSYISQLMTDEDFLVELSAEKYKRLQEASTRDQSYDDLEDVLIEQLKTFAGIMTDPLKIARVLQIINAAKRRGAQADPSVQGGQGGQIVTLVLPSLVHATFVTNVNNQIISDGTRELRTIPFSDFAAEATKVKNQEIKLEELGHDAF